MNPATTQIILAEQLTTKAAVLMTKIDAITTESAQGAAHGGSAGSEQDGAPRDTDLDDSATYAQENTVQETEHGTSADDEQDDILRDQQFCTYRSKALDMQASTEQNVFRNGSDNTSLPFTTSLRLVSTEHTSVIEQEHSREIGDTTTESHEDAQARYEKRLLALETSIETARVCGDSPSHGNTRAIRLSNLGFQFCERYDMTGAIQDLDQAIENASQALRLIPEGDLGRGALLGNLGSYLVRRYHERGDMRDLEEAIEKSRLAVQRSRINDSAIWLSNIAVCFKEKYEIFGAFADLEEAIKTSREAVVASQDHPQRAGILNTVAGLLMARYEKLGTMIDLDEAIETAQKAVNTAKEAKYLLMLSNSFIRRFGASNNIEDLDKGIATGDLAVEMTSTKDPEWPLYANNVGSHMTQRYRVTKNDSDLDKAIELLRTAVRNTNQEHRSHLAARLANLAIALRTRLGDRRTAEDHEEELLISLRAANTIPRTDINQSKMLLNLINSLERQYISRTDIVYLELAYEFAKVAFRQSTAPASARLEAIRAVLISAWGMTRDKQSMMGYAHEALEVIPDLIQRSLQNTDKQRLLLRFAGLASEAAGVALRNEQPSPDKALLWLEKGRGILASGLHDLRADTSALRQHHPELAVSFERSRSILDQPMGQDHSFVRVDGNNSLRIRAEERRKAQDEFEETLQKIRNQTGFEDFNLSLDKNGMLAAAEGGAIVVINTSLRGCDALIIQESGIRSIGLAADFLENLSRYRVSIPSASSDMLEWLWDDLVAPVLAHLQPSDRFSQDKWPRVWWIPTGSLVGFPIHAAGYHLEAQNRTTLDRVISSYATSIRSIVQTRLRKRSQSKSKQLVLVAMETTPGQGHLNHANKEIQVVCDIGKQMQFEAVSPQKKMGPVQDALQNCEIFHFAGHGTTHLSQPLQSHLLLDDWKTNPLTVQSLLELNLHRQPPFLAYLSACGTSQILDYTSTDENIHLCNACQLAGFRHVIGTLWTVDDELCVTMARLVYQTLHEKDFTDESVSYALHVASRELRDNWVQIKRDRDERGSVRGGRVLEGSKVSSPLWVPYVHYGP
ncbi:hypothetical protein E8E14_005203 [Neopestalotiopsis sp. 37M]|nr:hypothetical protein E8E14_005203 [Neopestalotiopsis sp. 37M]